MTKSFQIANALSRALLIAACLLFLTLTFFVVKWCVGDVIAAHAPAKDIAQLGVDFAPNDPQTHYALAVISGKTAHGHLYLLAVLPDRRAMMPCS